MDDAYIVGLCEGECSFIIAIVKSEWYAKRRHNLRAKLIFALTLHKKDIELLKKLRAFFNCGSIYFARNEARFTVENFKDINEKIIPFFDSNPLLGKKSKDYRLWKKASRIFIKKQHLTIKGIKELSKIREHMNPYRADRRIKRFS